MLNLFSLLQAGLNFSDFKFSLICYVTAFVLTMIFIPPVIMMVKRYRLFDKPNARKEHQTPIPTFGGLAVFGGAILALLLWINFQPSLAIISFFISMVVLLGVGMMDDLKDLSPRYKLVVELALASLLAISGIRITSFGGLFGITELNLFAQYMVTVVTVVGITNAFNLIDGIDGLAGGMGFMSLVTLGIFLTLSGDFVFALFAFAWAGALLAFLYYNLNPARIFMGDTGSLVLGFVIAILCVELMKINSIAARPVVPHIHVFTLAIVLIPVFDTLRVFGTRIWQGRSPFSPDKTHIHHLLTNQGFSHATAKWVICLIHGFILILAFWMKHLSSEWQLAILGFTMLASIFFLKQAGLIRKLFRKDEVVEVGGG